MLKPALLFDFGGVFMKTVNYRPRHAWDERLGLAHGSVERIVHGSESWRAAQTGKLTTAEYWADVRQQLGLDEDSIATLEQDYFSGDELDLELVKYARGLQTQGYPIGLLSNDSLALMDKLQSLGIRDLFNPAVISAQIGVMKPDPQAYQIALERLGNKPGTVIFIDDMPANIDGARQLGIHAIQYTTTPALQASLTSLLKMGF
jgi:putative hydrolase of the HAD superfamily